MPASKSLPARPSLESLRKQAKRLARATATGDVRTIARARDQLPNVRLPLTQRDAQLVIAREYGYDGWRHLVAEVSRRLGKGVEWAVAEARRLIHDNDVDRLTRLLDEVPALLTWRGPGASDGLLGMATGAYGDSFDANREASFTRAGCAELLIDRGAVVVPSVLDGLVESRARRLLQLFRRKGLLPHTLRFYAALGDLDAVRASLDENGNDLAAVNAAFMVACRFGHEAVASALLDRSIVLDPALGTQVDQDMGRAAFIRYLMADKALAFIDATPAGPWQAFLMERVARAVGDGDLATFVGTLQRESWLLDDRHVGFQTGLIERATLRNRGEFIAALLEMHPALGRRQPPPRSQAIEIAMTYVRPHLLPLLTRIWPVPDDLPHAAAMGDPTRVKAWFDESGAPTLGDLRRHYPFNSAHTQTAADLGWEPPTAQHVLDSAFAWAVLNNQFGVADFLLERGANIDTTWGSHEPASVLHELVGQVGTGESPTPNYEAMQFLIDRGIDLTTKDYRWNSTVHGWALYAARDEQLAQWLQDAAERRTERPREEQR